MNLLIAPFVNALFAFYYLLGNLGWSIVVVTVLIRLVLLPLVLPSLKSAQKMQGLQPKLKKLQDKFGKDKEGLAKAQMDLYKNEGVNPLSGCLPNILQIAVLIIFFSAFNMVSSFADGKTKMEEINKHLIPSFQVKDDFKFTDSFFGVSLSATPNGVLKEGLNWKLILPFILLIGSGYLQYWSSKKMMPTSAKSSGEAKPVTVNDTAYTKETPGKEDDMMAMMRTQSTYMMPLMTIFIGFNFSVGILLYWFVNSAVMAGQQILMTEIDKRKEGKV
ncbi:YidC/Oxa1 family membrane protein insertase [Candidatus Shapirobacteria bacterium]|nr:YidC/Oxa1 family membrane protein insertase [Candidatus Shapirobacteria bacterium]